MPLSLLKDRLVGLLGVGALARLVASRTGPSLVVVMMHRFSTVPGEYRRHDPDALRRVLGELRLAGVELVEVEDALAQIAAESGVRTRGAARYPRVAFTVDDGYADVLDVAAPVFREFECPVTCFVAPGIVEGGDWYWWDKVETLLTATAHRALDVEFSGESRFLPLEHSMERHRAFEMVCEWIKRMPSDQIPEFLELLSERTEVELPSVPPSKYRMLTWEAMRSAEQFGWRFGAHTMTHPLLGRCTAERAEREIVDSLEAVRKHLANPSGVFCYPVGREGDFGTREFAILERQGVRWALASTPGVIRAQSASRDSHWRLRVPRFAHDERPGGVLRMFLS